MPYNYESDIPLDTDIRIRFSGNISTFTLKTLEVNVTDQRTGESVEGEVEINHISKMLQIDSKDTYSALGWLAREGKILFKRGKQMNIR